MAALTREELDAKLAATEARVEAMEARIEASLDKIENDLGSFQTKMLATVGHLPTTPALISTVAGAAVSVVAIVVGVLAFGGDRFDGGVQVTSVSVQQAQEAREIAKANEKKVDDFIARVDDLLQRIISDQKLKQ
ncbi:hypothetical protein MesoLj131b_67280 [Mesorhizobium sp. 131-2-5]|uniref:hypothetical protein n=1 Tax=Mesorhizobium sp. 131-2-5 TaxID=2744519 RepID=UPI0019261C52|nr:hypothetical protein [Mesorhizobium sp. 131-2-5]BCH04729.1 hypothetical protein MesoLj131b_67280 [Mesorhizobium sp. 131-2-5]